MIYNNSNNNIIIYIIIDGYVFIHHIFGIFLGDERQVDYQLFLVWKPVDCQGVATLGRDQCLKRQNQDLAAGDVPILIGRHQKQWFIYIYVVQVNVLIVCSMYIYIYYNDDDDNNNIYI